ncbi:hypothetical protein COHA_006923 [Chlorella ohadii]|uniref:RRM domain-containing protein n=1 Tax=Chlorella ohadii TaxID=2649997 RepID=A0AAD5H4S5_9CHLO|nr:hypothetical protein COHA_006923 [Chlorella ohadii]
MDSNCVLVSGLDGTVHANEMRTLFESAGPVTQIVTLSPSAAGGEAAVLIWFASRGSAKEAADLFNDHPHAGAFLEVKLTDGAAATRALAALAEVQTAAPGSSAQAAAMPRTNSSSLTAATATGPAVTFPGGASVPMPAPFAGAPAAATQPAGSAAGSVSASRSGSTTPEPPVFGGPDFNPDEWAVPADWTPPAAAVAAAAPATAAKPAAGKAAAQPGVPVWETDNRCRIFITGLRPGCSADDLKSYFWCFGPLVDASVVPKQHIGFLTFAKPEDGETCLNTVHNTSVPGLSPSGPDVILCRSRNSMRSASAPEGDRPGTWKVNVVELHKIQRHITKTAQRPDVVPTPTTRVFIGYFPRSTKRRDVEIELQRYGELREVMLGGGTDGGELFCFVQFCRVQDAAAMYKAVHGHAIPTLAGGRKLVCAFKEPRR